MNRWKTKKRAKEADSGTRGPSTDSEVPPMPVIKTSKSFMFGRKTSEPAPKPEINLENALPSKDDFRTSLLMSGLSARFSMLREQDDPSSKLGKASDDSVLFPKRQSRLIDFGFQGQGLSDIAEVSSIRSSIRPPFAYSRTESYHDGYGTDEEGGSIMNRKKPTEGNNLFGGRQKIYKIPTNAISTKTVNDASTGNGMAGRALYDDDVGLSAFQKLREKEKQEQREREGREQETQEDRVQSRSTSPSSNGYNRNRETSSTTATTTSITRSSTAATSITSQRTPSLSSGNNPVLAKTRRLYENGLDQQLHEQQNSAINRIDSLSKQRKLGIQTPPPGVSSPIMGGGTGDRWDRHPMAGKQSMPNLRAASPTSTVTPIGTFDFGVKPITTSNVKPWGVASPPLSPPTSEYGDATAPVIPIQPNDRGKATALGAFTKPNQAYDDGKYAQRQLQLQQDREAGSTSPALKDSPPRFMPRPQQQHSQQGFRNRGESNATSSSERSRSNSSALRRFPSHEFSSINHEVSVPEHASTSENTFLESPDPSPKVTPNMDSDTFRNHAPTPLDFSRLDSVPEMIMERPSESQHPANRTQSSQSQFEGNSKSATQSINTSSQLTAPTIKSPIDSPIDSPTLGPASGLNNIRQHLRSDSNSSSLYSNIPSAGMTSRFPEHPMGESQSGSTQANTTWDDTEWDRRPVERFDYRAEPSRPPTTRLPNLPPPTASVNPEHKPTGGDRPSWEQELDLQHNRNGSSATQKEQKEFHDELAARRRQIKENMKSFVESESRSSSPVPGGDGARDFNPMRHPALSILKSKASRTSLAGKSNKENGSNKAMKMLGLNGSNASEVEPDPKNQFDNNTWKAEEEEMMRGVAKRTETPQQTKDFRRARRDAQRDRERQIAERHQFGRPPQDDPVQRSVESSPIQHPAGRDRFPPNIRTAPRDRSRDRKPPPVAYNAREELPQDAGSRAPSRTSRDRSSSEASGRSRSRNGRHKDDLARAMADGLSSSAQGYDELNVPSSRFAARSPAISNFQPSPIPSPMIGTPRSRSNSVKTPGGGYFDPIQKFPTLVPTPEIDHMSPRPSPAFSVNSTPSLARPSQALPVATPTNPGFQNPNQSKVPVLAARKRSINKSDISEPTLISSTSRITTVNLPPGSSLQNGAEPHSAPPIPPVNPRRRQTRTMFGFGRKDGSEDHLHSLPAATQSTEEMSTFSADESEKPHMKERQKLRKSSSEGGALNARARQAAFAAPSPALPTSPFPPNMNRSGPRPSIEGEMF